MNYSVKIWKKFELRSTSGNRDYITVHFANFSRSVGSNSEETYSQQGTGKLKVTTEIIPTC